MRSPRFVSALGALAGAVLAWTASPPAGAAELYLAGDIGISSIDAEGDGFNSVVDISNSGESNDSSPVYGVALGMAFPLDSAIPARLRIPGFSVPYWPGRALRFHGSEDVRLPDWDVRFEAEYLRGRDVELSTPSFAALEPYRSDVGSWSVMGKLRLDVPVRTPLNAIIGRVPFLDPLTLYVGGGAGLGVTELDASTGIAFGSEETMEFAWQAVAGLGYRLNERVTWSVGWRFYDLGEVETRLADVTGTDRGRYGVDLHAHEFTTSLSFAFWRVPFLGDE